jgi:hypothetical protein
MPWVGSELLFETFELALELRELDMRASPYDLSAYGLDPVPIETEAGRADYVRQQQAMAAKAAPLRQRLIDALQALLSTSCGIPRLASADGASPKAQQAPRHAPLARRCGKTS